MKLWAGNCKRCGQFFSFDVSAPPIMGWFCLACDYIRWCGL